MPERPTSHVIRHDKDDIGPLAKNGNKPAMVELRAIWYLVNWEW